MYFFFLLHTISKNLESSATERRYMKGIFNYIIQKIIGKLK